jgi:glycerol uptake facilitator protein/aquaporin Z
VPSRPVTGSRPSTATLLRHAGAELVLTTVLLFGVETAVRWVIGPSPVSEALGGIHLELVLVGAAVGLVIYALISSPLGRASGGHMNPAISVAMWRYGVFPARSLPPYIAAQLIGSVLGVGVGRLVWGRALTTSPVSWAALQPASSWRWWMFFPAEALTMAVIVFVVGVCLASPRLSRLVPAVVGLLVGGAIAALGTVTGGSANPARQFGPAVWAGQTHLLWAYLTAPIVGALVGPAVRDALQRRRVPTARLCGEDEDRPS